MANIQAATVTTGAAAGANLVRAFYDRVLLERVYQETRFYQFGDKRGIPSKDGNAITWNRKRALGLGMQLSEGVPTSTGYALSTTKITATIAQYGGHVPISDLIDLTSITDMGQFATEELGDQAARTIDRVIANEIILHASASDDTAHYLFKTSTEVTDYWGMTSTTAAGIRTVSSTNVLAVSDLRSAAFKLRALGAPRWDGRHYMAIMNTETAEDIAGDSTWINFHQYTMAGIENLYNGEIGMVYGLRVIETNWGPSMLGSNAGGTASTVAYGTTIFGKGFFGCVDLNGGIKTMGPITGASKSDPLDQTTIFGWKANFTARITNPSCGLVFFAGSGDTTTAAAESAGGPRDDNPPAY